MADQIDKPSPANGGMRISEAQANFMSFHACSREFIDKVRKPHASEKIDPEWSPLDAALRIFEKSKAG